MTAVTGMEDPRTSERHSQSYDPGGGKHGKCESLPRSMGLWAHVHLLASGPSVSHQLTAPPSPT